MEVLFAFILLALVGANGLLFAMMGELARRVQDSHHSIGDKWLVPVEGVRLGHRPAIWPDGLSSLAAAPRALVLVLSSTCNTCSAVAAQLERELGRDGSEDMAVVVTARSLEAGRQFVERHRLEGLTRHVDEGGRWVRDQLNLTMSPTGLVFEGGRLVSALSFSDLRTLRAATVAATPSVQEVVT